jgi:hypothetical protein
MESKIITIAADFEPGDRAFYQDFGRPFFGTVKEVAEDEVVFSLDAGSEIIARQNVTVPVIENLRFWQKPLPVNEVEAGSRISCLVKKNELESVRVYATVLEHVAGTSMTVKYDEESWRQIVEISPTLQSENSPLSYHVDVFGKYAPKPVTVESMMRSWELEG